MYIYIRIFYLFLELMMEWKDKFNRDVKTLSKIYFNNEQKVLTPNIEMIK